MTEREKLIDLLCYIPGAEEIADFFLANGVTIPVLCKDCKHYVWDEFDGCYVCMKLSKYVKTDFWCAYGEKETRMKTYTPHEVAVILADLFGDSCACNFNGIDEWLPEKCELLDSCPNTVGVACWEQYLKFRGERKVNG